MLSLGNSCRARDHFSQAPLHLSAAPDRFLPIDCEQIQVLCPAPGLGFQHCTYHTGAPEINVSNHIQMALSLGSGTQCEYSEVSNPKLPLYELTPSGLRKTLLYISCLIFSKQKVTTSECNEVCGLYHCQYWRWKCLWSVEWLEQWKNLDKRQINLQV